MENKKIYPHANHRQRVRDSFRKTDPLQLPDRSLVEMLLFYSIPRKDTNEIAGALMEKYGSLANILSASYEELMATEGMGESSALLMKILPEISRRYVDKSAPVVSLAEPDELMKYISDRLKGCDKEIMIMLCLDPFGKAVDCITLGEGDTTEVTVDKRDVLEGAFRADADSVILAHNHPQGEAAPSPEDIELTKELSRLLAETGIKLSDHIIVCKEDILSLKSTAKYKSLF